jgi:hypothetical protein
MGLGLRGGELKRRCGRDGEAPQSQKEGRRGGLHGDAIRKPPSMLTAVFLLGGAYFGSLPSTAFKAFSMISLGAHW